MYVYIKYMLLEAWTGFFTFPLVYFCITKTR